MGTWSQIDALEQEIISAQTPVLATRPGGIRGLLSRIRQYLPGAQDNEPWGKPSPQVYFHQVHVCVHI